MKKALKLRVENSKGEEIRLTNSEKYHAAWCERQIADRFGNDLGYEVSITTLTQIVKKVSQQKFYQIPFARYIPVVVGEGTWSSNLLHYRSYEMGDQFETGILNLGGQNARLASADAGVDALTVKVYNWAKSLGWNIFEL